MSSISAPQMCHLELYQTPSKSRPHHLDLSKSFVKEITGLLNELCLTGEHVRSINARLEPHQLIQLFEVLEPMIKLQNLKLATSSYAPISVIPALCLKRLVLNNLSVPTWATLRNFTELTQLSLSNISEPVSLKMLSTIFQGCPELAYVSLHSDTRGVSPPSAYTDPPKARATCLNIKAAPILSIPPLIPPKNDFKLHNAGHSILADFTLSYKLNLKSYHFQSLRVGERFIELRGSTTAGAETLVRIGFPVADLVTLFRVLECLDLSDVNTLILSSSDIKNWLATARGLRSLPGLVTLRLDLDDELVRLTLLALMFMDVCTCCSTSLGTTLCPKLELVAFDRLGVWSRDNRGVLGAFIAIRRARGIPVKALEFPQRFDLANFLLEANLQGIQVIFS